MRFRSLIFVPALEKKLKKIPDLQSDAFIIDLEDSISNNDKENALLRTIDFLTTVHNKENIFIRINSENIEKELKALNIFEDLGFMIPKVKNAKPFDKYYNLLKDHNVIALIENPLAIVNIREISENKVIDALAFGAEDYTATLNMENAENNLIYPRSVLCVFAKAFGKNVYDTPSFRINDEVAFKKEVDIAVNMGFDGKMLIHPKHIEYINEAFSHVDLELMKQIVDKYDKCNESVMVFNGNIYEKMHINRMKKILKENM